MRLTQRKYDLHIIIMALMHEEKLWKVPCCGKVFNFYHKHLENALRLPHFPQHYYNYEYKIEWCRRKSDRSFLNEMKISLV